MKGGVDLVGMERVRMTDYSYKVAVDFENLVEF